MEIASCGERGEAEEQGREATAGGLLDDEGVEAVEFRCGKAAAVGFEVLGRPHGGLAFVR